MYCVNVVLQPFFLVLSFSAENPNPSRGERQLIVLNQADHVEEVQNKKVSVSVEIVFELNYSTGQWRRLQRKKVVSADGAPRQQAG